MASLCDDIRGMANSILNTPSGEGIGLGAVLDTGAAVSLTFCASFEGSEEFTSTVHFTEEHVALFNTLKSSVPGVVVQLSRLLDAKRDALLADLQSRKTTAAQAREAAAARLAAAQAELQAAEDEEAAIARREAEAEQLRMFPADAAPTATMEDTLAADILQSVSRANTPPPPVRKPTANDVNFEGLAGKHLKGEEVVYPFTCRDGTTKMFRGTIDRQVGFDKVRVVFSDGEIKRYAMTGSQGAELARALERAGTKRARETEEEDPQAKAARKDTFVWAGTVITFEQLEDAVAKRRAELGPDQPFRWLSLRKFLLPKGTATDSANTCVRAWARMGMKPV